MFMGFHRVSWDFLMDFTGFYGMFMDFMAFLSWILHSSLRKENHSLFSCHAETLGPKTKKLSGSRLGQAAAAAPAQ